MTATRSHAFERDGLTWLAYAMLAHLAYVLATLGPLMPFLREALRLSYTQGGLLLTASATGIILAGLTGDRLARRWGRPSAFWGGAAGLTLCAVGLALSGQFVFALASIWGMGICGSVAISMIQAILADRHGEHRTIALTESNVAASLSACLAPLCIGGFQRLGVGWQGALFLPLVTFALIVGRFHREPVSDSAGSTVRPESSARVALPFAFWAFWVVICLVVSIEWCLGVWGADFLENVVGLSKVQASTTMSVFLGAVVIGRMVGSRLTRVLPSVALLLAALAVTLVGFPIFWLARFAPVNIAGLFIAGLGVANFYPLTMSIAVGLAPGPSDTASARVSLGVGVAVLVAPLLLGWAADQYSLQIAYSLVPVFLALAAAVVVLNRRAPTRHEVMPTVREA
jgi:fucose permease